jgi:hypothetical protein
MDPLPGFTLDEESVLVPLPSAASQDEPVGGTPNGAGGMGRSPTGRRVRLSLGAARAGAGVSILGAVVLTAGVVSGGIGLPALLDSGTTPEARSPAASAATPELAVDTTWVARLGESVKVAQVRHRRHSAAIAKRSKQRAAARSERKPSPPAPAPVVTQVSNPPEPVRAAPVDPWAGVPGAVREFEPGPWNNGGATS